MRKLRDRMHEDLTLRGLSAKTIDSYLRCVRKFAEHFGRSPSALGADEIREFSLNCAGARSAPRRSMFTLEQSSFCTG